jgi:RNA polymerase sigma-70 factor (ECF subfamily)
MNEPVILIQTEKTDAELIAETKAGTLTSFETLVKRYEKRLTGFAYKRVLDSDTAADIAQETFIRVFKKIDTFDTTKPFSPWMYTIAKNLSLDIIRKGKHTAALEWEIEDGKESLISRIIKGEQVIALWNAIRSLPEKYRKPLVGYYFADQSIRELAYNFNMSENTIKTHLLRAKKYLRVELGRKGYG